MSYRTTARQQYPTFAICGDGKYIVVDEHNHTVHLWNDKTAAEINALELGAGFHQIQPQSASDLRATFKPAGYGRDDD